MANFLLLGCLLAFVAYSIATPLGQYYQGDMKFSEAQIKLMTNVNQEITPSSGLLDTFYRWPRNDEDNVEVPYRIQALERFSKLI